MIAGVQIFNALAPLVDNRVYPFVARETQDPITPYIIYQPVSIQPETTMDGITGHEWVNMQIDIYHSDIYALTLLSNKVINRINSNIKHSQYDGAMQTYDKDSDLYRITIEYGFFQTTPTT